MAEPTRADIQARIERALATFDVEVETLTPDVELDAANIDSLDLVELSQIIHDEYGVDLRPGDFEGVTTYGGALDVVFRRAGV